MLFLAAWPWEIFQRLSVGGTVASAAGLVLILLLGLRGLVAGAPLAGRLRTGLEAPILLIAAACVQSWLHSLDRTSSLALLRAYLLYSALFYAALMPLQGALRAASAWRLLSLSAALVGGMALLCAAGWLSPVLVSSQEYFGRRLSEDLSTGAFVRIAATTPDFNQGILPMLVALPAGMLLLGGGNRSRTAWPRILVAVLLSTVLVAGVVVSFSRSGLLAVVAMSLLAAVAAARKYTPGRMKQIAPLLIFSALGLLLLAVLFLLTGGYGPALAARLMRGFGIHDPSYQSRVQVIGLAMRLLPKYAWLGCGLGASSEALASLVGVDRWRGATIHCMPLLLLVETGLLGLAGYCWFWARLFRRLWRAWRRADDALYWVRATACISAAGLFWMLLVQPFQALSLFPVLAALMIAPLARVDSDATTPLSKPNRLGLLPAIAAMSITLAVVIPNVFRYESKVDLAGETARCLERALVAEQRGDSAEAEVQYQQGSHVAPLLRAAPNEAHPSYAELAAMAVDLDFLVQMLPGGLSHPVAGDLAAFGAARCAYDLGDFPAAVKQLAALCEKTPDWPEPLYALGEALWRSNEPLQALDRWGEAAASAQKASVRPNTAPADAPALLADSMKFLEQSLATADTPERRAMLLFRLGRWRQAEPALAGDDGTAKTTYLRGVLAEKRQQLDTAKALYESVLRQEPAHTGARTRLSTISGQL